MGCSSSALNKAGDGSRFRSGVPLNENSSTGEQSKFCVAQPMPCTPGREAAFYGSAQRPGQVPLERPKASVLPTANGVKSCHQPSLANDEASGKDAADPSGPTTKTEPLVQGEESDLLRPGGKDDTLGAEEMKKDVETRTESQSLKGNVEAEPLGTEAGSQPLSTPGEKDSQGAVEDSEIPQAARGTKLLETARESALPLETAELPELPPEEEMRKDEQPQTAEAIPKESNSPEVAEGGQSAESSEKQQPQEAPCKDEQPQLLERILKESETPQVPDGSQLEQTPVMNESLCETPDGTRNTQGSHPEASVGSREKLAGAAETAANVDMAREIHTDKEEQHIEGETGEKMEAEKKHEKGSEEAEVKEQETGEAADVGPAGDSDGRATAHSLL
ncbi:glutamate-rich protein 5 [Arvicola amphibius]|uniref:glutamate-rich protein 5 n=1 Tax=Arvicola amphibius TaxID=1047088 RepID=UPI0018E2D8CF|nr:glutamate-rich protein 5 [Arvicola amphibius]